jgi:NAD(P)-dependent dehydrogenase (short-subunit alcohol dehydrogenase family)
MNKLNGQLAVVTGGARNIGRAVAIAMAQAGARVVIVDVLEQQAVATAAELVEMGHAVFACTADLTDGAAVNECFKKIAQDHGGIHILCNNAGGGVDGIGLFEQVDTKAWWSLFDRNIRSTVLCTHAALPGMLKQGQGCIINTTSLFAFTPSKGGTSAYNAAKAAVTRFTEDVAAEVHERGVYIFCLHPGGVRPAPNTYLDKPLPNMSQEEFEAITSRLTDPPEYAARLSVQLASGSANLLSGRFFDATEDFEQVVAQAASIVQHDLRHTRIRRSP